jgi:hydroxymethylglutaryl-CoA synthase
MQFGIAAIGGYLPLLRLDRKIAAKELAWSGLGMPRAGFRTVADWDEDSLTMAVESACHSFRFDLGLFH